MQTQQQEIGYCTINRKYLTYLDGLPSIRVNQLVKGENGALGVVHSLSSNEAEVLILTESNTSPGDKFFNTGETLGVNVGDFLLGRAINPLGTPIDGKGMLASGTSQTKYSLEQEVYGIDKREFIQQQLVTGITLIDSLIPLGKGQRELVIGDSNAGISDFLVNIIVNQKSENVVCIYAVIGKPVSYIRNLLNSLSSNMALSRCVVVATSATENPPIIFLTPKTAMVIAKYFQAQGKDVIIVLDDMGIHAKTYREISLLANSSPGRESFPGDIFFQQAQLMELAGSFKVSVGGGSITALPVIELDLVDFTGFISTNLMSITDGHLLFKSNLFNTNQRPAIDLSLSVSRVGRQTQQLIPNLLSKRVRQIMSLAESFETISRFSSELPEATQRVLRQEKMIGEITRQEDLTFVAPAIQTILLGLIFTNFFKDKNELFVRKNKPALIDAFSKDPELFKITQSLVKMKSDEELIQALDSEVQRLEGICK